MRYRYFVSNGVIRKLIYFRLRAGVVQIGDHFKPIWRTALLLTADEVKKFQRIKKSELPDYIR